MICNDCGTELDISAKFCPQCGAPAAETVVATALNVPSIQKRPPSNTRRIIAWLCLLTAAAVAITLLIKTPASPDKDNLNIGETSPITNSPNSDGLDSLPATQMPQAPPLSGLTLRPYDLLKDPYQAQGKLIVLDLNTLPVLYEGAVIQYSDPINPTLGARLGLMALRFERMADQTTALYNIMGVEAGQSSNEMLGQIAIKLPEGEAELKLDRAWMVEPMQPLKGTNYMGAEIQIPYVRFWHYMGEKDGDSSATVNEVSSEGSQTTAEIPNNNPSAASPAEWSSATCKLRFSLFFDNMPSLIKGMAGVQPQTSLLTGTNNKAQHFCVATFSFTDHEVQKDARYLLQPDRSDNDQIIAVSVDACEFERWYLEHGDRANSTKCLVDYDRRF